MFKLNYIFQIHFANFLQRAVGGADAQTLLYPHPFYLTTRSFRISPTQLNTEGGGGGGNGSMDERDWLFGDMHWNDQPIRV